MKPAVSEVTRKSPNQKGLLWKTLLKTKKLTQVKAPYTPKRYETKEEVVLAAQKYANQDFYAVEQTLLKLGLEDRLADAKQALFEVKLEAVVAARKKALTRKTVQYKVPDFNLD